MKIFARGEKIRIHELQQKLESVNIDWTIDETYQFDNSKLQQFDLIFDLNADEQPQCLEFYAKLNNKPVIIGAVKKSLAQALQSKVVHCHFIGLNTLPTFINREIAEVSIVHSADESLVSQLFKKLNWNYKLVTDRVGMVTPRVICMIINEACYTVQEGTASIKDIDISMKLGTNYPYGPFEWADKIGISHVYESLNALYEDTHDERYKICSLLKAHYLKQLPFLT